MSNLIVEPKGKHCWITINRPQQLNALDLETLNELHKVVQNQSENESVISIIITGSGDKSFVAGADIPSIKQLNQQTASEFAHAGHECFEAIELCAKPVIAAVNGYCLGGGFELALSCDFIVASSNAVFGLPEVSLGIFPGWGGTQRLPRVIGRNRARELIFTAAKLKADEALQWGIVNHVCQPEELDAKINQILQQLEKQAPVAVSLAKKAVREGMQISLDQGLARERDIWTECFRTEDAKEGLLAFIEKRKPTFIGR